MSTTEILLERALVLIMDEWGKTREEALAWLNDDATDWTPTPQFSGPHELDGKPRFIQVTRVSNCQPPGLTAMHETLLTPAMIDEMARKESLMIFPEPIDAHTIPNRGVVYITLLPAECRRRDLEALQGTTVTLGGRPFRVRGVESRCVECQRKGWPIGLLGEYLGDIPGTRPLTPDDVEEMNREP